MPERYPPQGVAEGELLGCIALLSVIVIKSALAKFPCGWHGDQERQCTCSPLLVARYQSCISGPLLDRIDIHVEVPRVNYEKLSSERQGEPSASIRERVLGALRRQIACLSPS